MTLVVIASSGFSQQKESTLKSVYFKLWDLKSFEIYTLYNDEYIRYIATDYEPKIKVGNIPKDSLTLLLDDYLEYTSSVKGKIAALHVKGKVAFYKNDFYGARNYYQRGIDLLDDPKLVFRKWDAHTLLAYSYLDILNDMAALYLYLDLNEEAEKMVSKALMWFEQLPTSKQPRFLLVKSNALIHQAELESRSGKNKEAIQTLKTALKGALNSPINFNMPHLYKNLYYNLGELFQEEGKDKKAIRNFKKIIYGKAGMGDLYVKIATSLSNSYHKTGDKNKAEKWLKLAEEDFQMRYSLKNYLYTNILDVQIVMAIQEQKSKESLSLIDDYFTILFNHIDLQFAYLTEKEKKDFTLGLQAQFNRLYQWLFEIYQMNGNQEILNRILQYRMKSKGVIFEFQGALGRNIHDDSILDSLINSYNLQKQKWAYSVFSPNSDRFELEEITKKYNAIEVELLERNKLLYENKREEFPLLTDILNQMDENESLLQIIRTEKDSFATYHFIAAEMGPEFKYAKTVLSLKEELKALKYYRNAIKYDLHDELTFSKIVSKAYSLVERSTKVYFDPDGILNQINPNSLFNPVSGEFLFDETYFVAVSNLKELIKTGSRFNFESGVLLGRPAYNSVNTDAATPDFISGSRATSMLQFKSLSASKFNDLPGTELETSAIAGLLNNKGFNTQLYLGEKATEEVLKDLDSPSVLHIATHGFFIENEQISNSFLKSGLILTGVNNGGGYKDDGILTALEVTALKFENTKLVVLSACDTGLGDIQVGEGVYGLQRAFKQAGAKQLVMSLWKVDDQATRKLMEMFYAFSVEEQDLEIGFQKAMKELKRQFPDPRLWAGFIFLK